MCTCMLPIAQLKEEVAKVMGPEAPVESQCLIFAGKILKDDQSVESQAVKDGVTIHLVIRSNKVRDDFPFDSVSHRISVYGQSLWLGERIASYPGSN